MRDRLSKTLCEPSQNDDLLHIYPCGWRAKLGIRGVQRAIALWPPEADTTCQNDGLLHIYPCG